MATIDRFIVPNTNDSTRDLAIGVAQGQDPEKVLQTYERSALPAAKLKQLQAGDKVFMAGWPEYQPKNTASEERQAFSMSVLGLGQTTTTEGKRLNVVWAAVTPTKDGAECSYGASGSEGFVMIDGQLRSIGTLSVFMDLSGRFSSGVTTPGPGAPSFSHNTAGAVCGFSYATPDLRSGGMILHAVRSAGEIPGYVSPDEAIATARAQFKDPAYAKTLINGSVEVPPPQNVEKGGPTWVSNPVMFRDAVHHNTVFAWADPADPDHLAFGYVEDKDLYEVVIYPHDGDAAPTLLTSAGVDQYQSDPSTVSGDFVDGSHQVFGGVLPPDNPNVNGAGFSLELEADGQLGIIGAKGGMK